MTGQLDIFGGMDATADVVGPPDTTSSAGEGGSVQLGLAVDVPTVRDMRRGRGLAVQDTLAQADS